MIGTYLLHYKLLKKIGEGGQGEVYQAEDTRLRRIVAIKILPAELVADEKTRKRFLREAQLASALDHPNICTVYEINEDRGLHFIVMQYLDGKRLKQMVRGRALDIESTLSIAVQLADALASAHERGVIHRDVKATNVIVNDRGQAKILDFGLAKATTKTIGDESVMELTQAGVPFGTAGYMSPEQARGGTIDARSDVFSLGIVIYEMAAGRLPFQGKSSVDVMHAIMHEPLPLLSSINPAVPERLQTILEKATAKEVTARYQTMRDFQAELKQLLRAVQMQLGQPMTDDSLLPMVAPRHERSNWLSGGVVGRLISRLRGAPERPPTSQPATPTVSPSRPADPPAELAEKKAEDIADKGQALRDSMPSSWRTSDKRSIAILPFRNLSGDAQTDFYSFSLADSVITELAGLKSIVVRPSSYMAKYQGRDLDPIYVGNELQVDAVMTSAYVKSGNRLRVTPQLIDVHTGEILWSDKIDLDAQDIITLQDTLAQKICEELRVRISQTEQERIAKPSTRNAEAFEYYLRGRNQLQRFRQTMLKDDFSAATEMFENALACDPNFALAHSGMGLCYVEYVLKGIGGGLYFERAAERFRQALALDDSLIEPQINMVYYYLLKGEKARAREQARRMLAIAPNDPAAHNTAAYLHRWDGLYGPALAEYDACLRLDPTDVVRVSYNRARIALYQGNYEEAHEHLDGALFVEPNHPFASMVLGQVLYYQGRHEESARTFRELFERNPDLHAFRPIYALGFVIEGLPDRARSLINDAVREIANADGDAAYWLATLYAALGDDADALHWLRRAIALGNENYPWFISNPDWAHLRETPAFQAIVEPIRQSWEQLMLPFLGPAAARPGLGNAPV
ncbi:MAG: protein kinase [Chloracidobacterium sp.]